VLYVIEEKTSELSIKKVDIQCRYATIWASVKNKAEEEVSHLLPFGP
jgi:hypothetical protein